MKTITLIIALLLSLTLNAQQIPLSGQVYEHNSQYKTGNLKPVSGAHITVSNAVPATSDVNGDFKLIVVGKPKGAPIQMKVESPGLEVVNWTDLQQVTFGRLSKLKVFLAPIGQIAKARQELYNVSLAAITKTHDEMIVRLKKGGIEMQQAIQELQEKTNRVIADRFEAERILGEQLEATKRRLPEFAEELARVNLDFASEMYRKAYAYFEKGDIDKAIETLDEAVLDEQARIAVEQMDSIDRSIAWLDSALALTEEHLMELVKSFELKAMAAHDDPASALKVYRTAIGVLERRGRATAALPRLYQSTGEVHLHMGAKDSAVVCFKLAAQALHEQSATPWDGLAALYRKIGGLYEDLHQLDSAVIWLDRAYLRDRDGGRIRSQEADIMHILDLLGQRAEELEEQEEYPAAAQRYRKMLEYLPSGGQAARAILKKLRRYE
jgi:tetratricopeptide (TPR) repeat protein